MGIYLSQPNKMKFSSCYSGPNLLFGASAMQGWRIAMEDFYFSYPFFADECSLFGILDGHGGREVACFVDKHFPIELKNNSFFKLGDMEKALRDSFVKMDELLMTQEGKRELLSYKSEYNPGVSHTNEASHPLSSYQAEMLGGCTALVILIYKKEIFVANSGDSRALIYSNNEIIEMSVAHRPELETEKKRIIKAGGSIHEGRINADLNISRAIGHLEYKKDRTRSLDHQIIIAAPEIKKHTLTEKDEFLLLGCDGIWETLSNREIVDLINSGLLNKEKLDKILEELLDSLLAPDTLSGLGCDNMTGILILLNQ